MSTPHTRGLPHPGPPQRGATAVDPAHAGITRRTGRRWRGSCGRPRTRGDYPASVRRNAGVLQSTPHTRGLPAGDGVGPGGGYVDPAHAGITRTTASFWSTPASRPRTRGDYPEDLISNGSGCRSTPHTRGLPCWPARSSPSMTVDPAHAGITPAQEPPWRSGRWSTPHTRGLPVLPRLHFRPGFVDPAHAGITPSQ